MANPTCTSTTGPADRQGYLHKSGRYSRRADTTYFNLRKLVNIFTDSQHRPGTPIHIVNSGYSTSILLTSANRRYRHATARHDRADTAHVLMNLHHLAAIPAPGLGGFKTICKSHPCATVPWQTISKLNGRRSPQRRRARQFPATRRCALNIVLLRLPLDNFNGALASDNSCIFATPAAK